MKSLALCGLCVAVLTAGCAPMPHELRQRGIAEFQVGQHAQARKLLRQCLDQTPADAHALYYMGRVMHVRGAYEMAMFYYQGCLEVDPSFDIARVWLARAQTAAGPSGDKLRFLP